MLNLDAKWTIVGKLSELMFTNKVSHWQCVSVAASTYIFIEHGALEGGGLIVVLSLSESIIKRLTAQKRINYCMHRLNKLCGMGKQND